MPIKPAGPRLPQLSASDELEFQLLAAKVPGFVREFVFYPSRKWRADFAFPALRFMVEIEGVTANGGRHQRIGGFLADLEKYHAAHMAGWTVYRCSPAMVKSGQALQAIERAHGIHPQHIYDRRRSREAR